MSGYDGLFNAGTLLTWHIKVAFVLKYIDMHLCFNRNKNLINSLTPPAQQRIQYPPWNKCLMGTAWGPGVSLARVSRVTCPHMIHHPSRVTRRVHGWCISRQCANSPAFLSPAHVTLSTWAVYVGPVYYVDILTRAIIRVQQLSYILLFTRLCLGAEILPNSESLLRYNLSREHKRSI